MAALYSAVLTALILIFVRRAFRSCGGLRVTAAEELAGLVIGLGKLGVRVEQRSGSKVEE